MTSIEMATDGKEATGTHAGEHPVDMKYGDLFSMVSGSVPFREPNIRPGYEDQDLYDAINKKDGNLIPKNFKSKFMGIALYGTLTLGLYPYMKWKIIPEGKWGFLFDEGSGHWRFLRPGNHNISSIFSTEYYEHEAKESCIRHGYITIVRVDQGHIGLAVNDSSPLVLMPGLHAFTNPAFHMPNKWLQPLSREIIYQNPITIFTVNTGTVRIGFQNGTIKIFDAGRYALNSPNFVPGPVISLQQLTQKLSNHTVLLDGGISLVVEGLVIYQVTLPAVLCAQLGVALDSYEVDIDNNNLDVNRKLYQRMEADIEKVTKAEIARVFAGIHLEDISNQSDLDRDDPSTQIEGQKPGEQPEEIKVDNNQSLLGRRFPRKRRDGDEAKQRSKICQQILSDVGPILSKWGITLHNFQLESTKIADSSYANEYEKASLAMAKAKADCRTQAQTAIQTRIAAEAASTKKRIETEADATTTRIKAQVDAEALKIKAEAEAKAKIKAAEADANSQLLVAEAKAKAKRTEAQAAADAKRTEGKARGDSADAMINPFAQQIALRELQVQAVSALKVNNLNVLSTAASGAPSWVEQLLPVSISAQMVRNGPLPALEAP